MTDTVVGQELMYPSEDFRYLPEVFDKKEVNTKMSIKLLKDDIVIGKAKYAIVEKDYGKAGAYDIPDMSDSDTTFLYYSGTITLKDTLLDNRYTYQDVNKVVITNKGITKSYSIFNGLELSNKGELVGKITN